MLSASLNKTFPSFRFQLETGYLKHVFNVFERLSYAFGDQESDWDVLWSHDYPFMTHSKQLTVLKSHQKVSSKCIERTLKKNAI